MLDPRLSPVREVIESLTDESLEGHTEPVEGPGYPPPNNYPVRECLSTVLNEEWEHRLYAERVSLAGPYSCDTTHPGTVRTLRPWA